MKKNQANYVWKTDKKEKNPWKNIKQVAATVCKKKTAMVWKALKYMW